jgi:hypothetical protein
LKGPPPGIYIHFFIFSLSINVFENSTYEPHESPTNAPKIQP